MGVYRAGAVVAEGGDLAQTLAPRRFARTGAGVMAGLTAFAMVCGVPLLPAAALGLVMAGWVVGRVLGQGRRGGASLEMASVLAPIVGGTLLALPLGLSLIKPLLRDLEFDWVVFSGAAAHVILLPVGALVAVDAVRRAPRQRLALGCLLGAALSIVSLILLSTSMSSSALDVIELYDAYGAGHLSAVPALFVVCSGVPVAPLLWWIVASRLRREGLAAPSAKVEGTASDQTGASLAVRGVVIARVGRIAGAGALLLAVALAIVHGTVSWWSTGRHPDATLAIWGVVGPSVAMVAWAAGRLIAVYHFDAVVWRSRDRALAMARRLEYASVTLPLAACMFVVPGALAGVFYGSLADESAIDLGRFLFVALFSFFPVVVLVGVQAMQYGWAVQTRPTSALWSVFWPRVGLAWGGAIAAGAAWSRALNTFPLFVLLAIVLAATFSIVGVYVTITAILQVERHALEKEALQAASAESPAKAQAGPPPA